MSSTELVSEIRMLVLEVRDLYRQLPDTIAHIAGLHAVSYDRVGSPSTGGVRVLGGDAAVMHNAGTDNGVTSSKWGDRGHAQDNHPDDPPSVLGVLCRIEDTWRADLKDGAADKTSIDASVAYLIANVSRAVLVLGMSDDVNTLTGLRDRLLHVTGTDDTPQPEPAPCVHCQGKVVRKWVPKTGLDDEARCERCGRAWPEPTHLRFTNRHTIYGLPTTHPDLNVTIEDAARICPDIRRNTLDVWVNRGAIVSTGRDERGAATYRLGDIVKLWDAREDRAAASRFGSKDQGAA